MRVWMVTVGEPLPTDGESVRLLRCGILSELLVERGHEVLWWNSTFDHTQKRQRFECDTELSLRPGYRIRLLHAAGYPRNISLERIANHRNIARKFALLTESEAPPDVILCSFPTIELCLEAVRYGARHGVPVVVDVRDPWPDLFVNAVPPAFRGLGRLALSGMAREARLALRGAASLTGTAEGYLTWGLRQAGRSRGPNDIVFPLGYRKPQASVAQITAAGEKLRGMGVDPNKVLCCFIGSFGRHYDLGTVIQGAREFAGRGDARAQFVLCGDGDQRARWNELARGLENVVFTGWVDVPEISYLLETAQVGLAAIEGVPDSVPNKLYEYFSGGLAVLSSLGGETVTLLERTDSGLTYCASDPGSFVAAVTTLLDDPEQRLRMGRNARQQYETRFAAEVVYPQMADYLFRMAQSREEDREPFAPSSTEGARG